MSKKADREASRERCRLGACKKISGTLGRPRLSVYRSERNIYAQIIDGVSSITLVSTSSLDKASDAKAGGSKGVAKAVDELVAKKALEERTSEIVLDRDGYVYYGGAQALVEAARETDLKF